MDEIRPTRVWTMRAVFVALALGILFVHLLPLDTAPRRWAPPDMLVAFSFAWALRRPDFVPAWLLALVLLLADLLLQRPPGLLAALVLGGVEYLKSRFLGPSDASFAGEWVAVALILVAIGLFYRLVLGVLGVGQAPVSLSVIQLFATILVYPLAVLATQSVLGVRKLAPSEAEALGGGRG